MVGLLLSMMQNNRNKQKSGKRKRTQRILRCKQSSIALGTQYCQFQIKSSQVQVPIKTSKPSAKKYKSLHVWIDLYYIN